MRILDETTWVHAIHAGLNALHASHAARGWFDSHDLINWLNIHNNGILNEIVDNYRITGQGKRAKNPVHTATREIGKFIERELGQVKIRDHQSVRDAISLAGGGVHPRDECENSVWRVDAATTRKAHRGVEPGATKHRFTLEYWRDGDWYVGRLIEVPGVFSQGKTLAELDENIQDAYELMVTQDRPPAPSTAQLRAVELQV